MTHEEIFLNILNEIRDRISDTYLTPQRDTINPFKKFDLIKACGLLRQLFLDEKKLVDLVNKDRKIPILFHIVDYKNSFPNYYNSLWFCLIPESGRGIRIGLSEFLKITPIIHEKLPYTILEIIQITANVIGGIHSRNPKDEKEKIFVNLIKGAGLKDTEYAAIQNICLVTIKALLPIESSILEHTV